LQVEILLNSNNLRFKSIKPKYDKEDQQVGWWVRLDEDSGYSISDIK